MDWPEDQRMLYPRLQNSDTLPRMPRFQGRIPPPAVAAHIVPPFPDKFRNVQSDMRAILTLSCRNSDTLCHS